MKRSRYLPITLLVLLIIFIQFQPVQSSIIRAMMGSYDRGTNFVYFLLDAVTEALVTIPYEHHELHQGNHYVIREYVDLSLNEVYDIQITTPDSTAWSHVKFWFESESETEFWVYENVTINVAGGDSYTPGNRNRNSANTSNLTINGITNSSIANANADTAVAGATQLANGVIGSGKSSSTAESREEVVLEQNEDYSVRFNANVAGYINFMLDGYQHTSHN